jgi:uncharacterized protein
MGLRFLVKNLPDKWTLLIKLGYWLFSLLVILSFWYLVTKYTGRNSTFITKTLISVIMISFVSKFSGFVFLAIDDVIRLFSLIANAFTQNNSSAEGGVGRKAFLVQTGALFATSIAAAMTYGVTKGSHRYRVIRQKLLIKDLPNEFDGLKVLQISDIHSGSFWNKVAVEKGVMKIVEEEADLIFFTGDLVNNDTTEMDEYLEVFKKITAPLGVFSILGNHDYGEYLPGFKKEHLPENIKRISEVHAKLGWKLLKNENHIIERNGQELAIIGVENWSNRMNFTRYGDLGKAYKGSENVATKLLLSHDPSHWKAEVTSKYSDISATFSGHTHGFQFGIETAGFKWSPIKYAYPEWAGLYEQGDQKLYVNRGFGYLGFPGRLGIWPEITVFELQSE